MTIKTEKTIVPVILAGGEGLRLQPLSTPQRPKPFLSLSGDGKTLMAHALDRINDNSLFSAPVIVAGKNHDALLKAALKDDQPATIIREPAPRNTAPALALACLHASETDPKALLLVMPADHSITPGTAFRLSVKQTHQAALDGHIVLFGAKAESAHTGYGYIESGPAIAPGFFTVRAFHEKPDQHTAARFVTEAKHHWNTGIFLARADIFIAELQRYAPKLLSAAQKSWEQRDTKGQSHAPSSKSFLEIQPISIDKCFIENTSRAVVHIAPWNWSDMGSWEAIANQPPKPHNIKHEPWGLSEILGQNRDYQIKRLTLKTGQSTQPYQNDKLSTFWFIMHGQTKIDIDDQCLTRTEQETAAAQAGVLYKLNNLSDTHDLVLLEVQTQDYPDTGQSPERQSHAEQL